MNLTEPQAGSDLSLVRTKATLGEDGNYRISGQKIFITFGEHDMAENTPMDVKKLSFERAIEELESIVKRLEDGKVPLEESVAIYERGEALKRRCDELLRQAEARVDKITTDANGQVTGTEPLDVQ